MTVAIYLIVVVIFSEIVFERVFERILSITDCNIFLMLRMVTDRLSGF
ncbi:2978_t:CDS:2 [Ambispora leptoticha]|uniref:2978_t:CDS:1 n=1 Tax=Ambispora leptoticha TaxID=144679 RepID=A0A9N8WFB6_9GLOM|nr:2978_t:CDS:2 [Ambispora leptoticha]